MDIGFFKVSFWGFLIIKLFLSYSREDEAEAEKLWRRLNAYPGVDVWWDKRSLMPGQIWRKEIEGAIRDADYFLVLLSTRSVVKRGHFQREIRAALNVLENDLPENAAFLVPIRIDNCTPHFERLKEHQYVDLFPDWDNGLGTLGKLIGLHRRMAAQDDGRVRFRSHQARFKSSPEMYYFVTVTNLTKEPIEVTHVWYEDLETHVPVLPKERLLPRRLVPFEIWETFLLKKRIPESYQDDAYESFRLRLSTGEVYISGKDGSVPPYGCVPGGDIDEPES